jgi:hypothetical protein
MVSAWLSDPQVVSGIEILGVAPEYGIVQEPGRLGEEFFATPRPSLVGESVIGSDIAHELLFARFEIALDQVGIAHDPGFRRFEFLVLVVDGREFLETRSREHVVHGGMFVARGVSLERDVAVSGANLAHIVHECHLEDRGVRGGWQSLVTGQDERCPDDAEGVFGIVLDSFAHKSTPRPYDAAHGSDLEQQRKIDAEFVHRGQVRREEEIIHGTRRRAKENPPKGMIARLQRVGKDNCRSRAWTELPPH